MGWLVKTFIVTDDWKKNAQMSSFKIATVILSLIVVCMTGPWLEASFKKCDFLLAEEQKKIPTQLGSLFTKHIILLIASAFAWVNTLDHPVYMEASLVRDEFLLHVLVCPTHKHGHTLNLILTGFDDDLL